MLYIVYTTIISYFGWYGKGVGVVFLRQQVCHVGLLTGGTTFWYAPTPLSRKLLRVFELNINYPETHPAEEDRY